MHIYAHLCRPPSWSPASPSATVWSSLPTKLTLKRALLRSFPQLQPLIPGFNLKTWNQSFIQFNLHLISIKPLIHGAPGSENSGQLLWSRKALPMPKVGREWMKSGEITTMLQLNMIFAVPGTRMERKISRIGIPGSRWKTPFGNAPDYVDSRPPLFLILLGNVFGVVAPYWIYKTPSNKIW